MSNNHEKKRRHIAYSLTNYNNKYFIPYHIIINNILPYYNYVKVDQRIITKELFGYFKIDKCRKIYYLWQSIKIVYGNKLIKHHLIVSLKLIFCNLTELIKYPYLQSLVLESCDNIKELKEYPNLQSIVLKHCNNIILLKKYPNLQSLHIHDCDVAEIIDYPNLKSLLLENFNIRTLKQRSSLQSLELLDCNLTELINYPNLEFLCLENCNVKKFKEYPKLKYLILRYCYNIIDLIKYPNLQCLELMYKFQNLK